MIESGKEVTVHVSNHYGLMKGIVEKFDDFGIKIRQNKKHVFIPNSSIIFIEWREKNSQKKLDKWINVK